MYVEFVKNDRPVEVAFLNPLFFPSSGHHKNTKDVHRQPKKLK